jgi:hypothetical protein
MNNQDRSRALIDSKGTPQHWLLLREIYEEITLKIFKYNGRADPYFVDWSALFTPIEVMAWSEVRSNGMHMFPQYPVGRYFLDFADPRNKIALECDGKQWHDEAKDRRRDADLFEMGWCVYRATGAECMRFVQPPADYREMTEGEEPDDEHLYRWYLQTIDGLGESIRAVHYGIGEATGWHLQSLIAHTYQDGAPRRRDVDGFQRRGARAG